MVFYGIRTPSRKSEDGHGVYDNWPSAVDGQYNMHQGFSNAAKFDTEEKARAWVDGRDAFPETRTDRFRHDVREKPFAVRLFVMSLMTTAFAFVVFTLARQTNNYLGCDTLLMKSHPVCLLVSRVDLMVAENYTAGVNFVATQMLTAIAGVFMWMFSLL